MYDFDDGTPLKGIPLDDLFKSRDMAEFYYQLLDCHYSRSKEEAELALELSPDGWQLPYVAIQEFIKSIVLVFNATLRLKETIGFVDYYWNNQSKYPADCQISKTEYELLSLILKKEISDEDYVNSEFPSSLTVLEEDNFFEGEQTKRSEYMLSIAIEFIEAIHNGSINKDFKLYSDLSSDEKVQEAFFKGHHPIPLNGYERYYECYYK